MRILSEYLSTFNWRVIMLLCCFLFSFFTITIAQTSFLPDGDLFEGSGSSEEDVKPPLDLLNTHPFFLKAYKQIPKDYELAVEEFGEDGFLPVAVPVTPSEPVVLWILPLRKVSRKTKYKSGAPKKTIVSSTFGTKSEDSTTTLTKTPNKKAEDAEEINLNSTQRATTKAFSRSTTIEPKSTETTKAIVKSTTVNVRKNFETISTTLTPPPDLDGSPIVPFFNRNSFNHIKKKPFVKASSPGPKFSLLHQLLEETANVPLSTLKDKRKTVSEDAMADIEGCSVDIVVLADERTSGWTKKYVDLIEMLKKKLLIKSKFINGRMAFARLTDKNPKVPELVSDLVNFDNFSITENQTKKNFATLSASLKQTESNKQTVVVLLAGKAPFPHEVVSEVGDLRNQGALVLPSIPAVDRSIQKDNELDTIAGGGVLIQDPNPHTLFHYMCKPSKLDTFDEQTESEISIISSTSAPIPPASKSTPETITTPAITPSPACKTDILIISDDRSVWNEKYQEMVRLLQKKLLRKGRFITGRLAYARIARGSSPITHVVSSLVNFDDFILEASQPSLSFADVSILLANSALNGNRAVIVYLASSEVLPPPISEQIQRLRDAGVLVIPAIPHRERSPDKDNELSDLSGRLLLVQDPNAHILYHLLNCKSKLYEQK